MPFRRKRFKKNSSIAKQALKIAKQARSSQEVKFLDTEINLNDVDWDGSGPLVLNDVIQGLTDSNRIGDSLKMLSLRARFFVNGDSAKSAGIRVIVIYDKRNTIISIDDLLAVTGTPSALISDYVHDKRSDYVVLYDKMYRLDGVYIDKWAGFWRRKLNKKTQYNSGTTTIERGSLKLFAISDISDAAVSNPNYTTYIRMFYTDS